MTWNPLLDVALGAPVAQLDHLPVEGTSIVATLNPSSPQTRQPGPDFGTPERPGYSGGWSEAMYLLTVLRFRPSFLAMALNDSPLSLRAFTASQRPLLNPVARDSEETVPGSPRDSGC